MWKRVVVGVSVALLGAGWCASSEAQLSAVGEGDRSFMMRAAEGGAVEVDLGRLATTRAGDDAVRRFGQRMVSDHGLANAQLQTLASRKGVSLPGEPGAGHRAAVDRLARLTGPEFDRAYMLGMVNDHDKDVSEFESASRDVQDAELRAWVIQTLPTLREHQRVAHQLSALAQANGVTPGVAVSSPAALPRAAAPPAVAQPWCQGAWALGQGTNFGTCVR